MIQEFIIDGLHALACQRSGVPDGLFANAAEAGVHRGIVRVCGGALKHPARTIPLIEPGVLGPIAQFGFLLGIEMIEIAVEDIETMHGRQVLIPVTQVILAKLPRAVAQRLENFRQRGVTRVETNWGSGHAHGRQAGADGPLPRDECGSARRAGWFRVMIGEQHPLAGQPVNLRCWYAHEAMAVGGDVPVPHVIGHDHEDVRPVGRRCVRESRDSQHTGVQHAQQYSAHGFSFAIFGDGVVWCGFV